MTFQRLTNNLFNLESMFIMKNEIRNMFYKFLNDFVMSRQVKTTFVSVKRNCSPGDSDAQRESFL